MIITEPVFYRAGSLHDGRLQRLNESDAFKERF